jgi:hypothetical protein
MNSDYLRAIFWMVARRPPYQYASTVLILGWCALIVLIGLGESVLAASASGPETHTQDEQNCATLTGFNLQALPGGPATIASAQVVDVPASGLERLGQSRHSARGGTLGVVQIETGIARGLAAR